MGLDNCIQIISKQEIDFKDIPDYVYIKKDDYMTKVNDNGFYYEVCYWRKCWNIRNIMLNILGVDINSWSNTYEIDKVDQIIELRDKLITYLCDLEIWEKEYDNGQTIWDSSEMADHIARDIITLSWLIRYLHNNKSVKVEFIDSY